VVKRIVQRVELGVILKLFIVSVLGIILIQPTTSLMAEEMIFRGVGAISCGELAENYRRDPSNVENMMLVWAQGFMSGANINQTPPGEYRDMAAMTLDDQTALLREYCDKHPFAKFINAAMDLYFKLPLKKISPSTSR